MKYGYIIPDHTNHDPMVYDTIEQARATMKEHITDIFDDLCEGDTVEGFIVEAVEHHVVELVRKQETKVTLLKD